MAGSGGDAPTGVVCDDRPDVRCAVAALLRRCGFEVAGEADTFSALCLLVREHRPAVAVLTLPLAGMSGLAAVRALRAQAPACELVLLSTFDRLEIAALEAGALALVGEDDLQGLHRVLRELAARTPQATVPLLSDAPSEASPAD